MEMNFNSFFVDILRPCSVVLFGVGIVLCMDVWCIESSNYFCFRPSMGNWRSRLYCDALRILLTQDKKNQTSSAVS
jgi:hypothetical protein